MSINELVNRYGALGVQLWAEGGGLHYRAPAGVLEEPHLQELRAHKQALLTFLEAAEKPTLTKDVGNRFAPFPLTEIQSAYLVGRGETYELGGVGCHGYVELTMPPMDQKRLENAWHRLIERHDMLRATFSHQGYQQVLARVNLPKLKEQSLRDAGPEEVDRALADVRRKMSSRRYAPDQWPLCELFLTTTDQHSILHISIDMLIADFVSIDVLLGELNRLYQNPGHDPTPLDVTFRDLLLFERARKDTPASVAKRRTDREYWLDRLSDLPGPPELPVSTAEGRMRPPSFSRHQLRLSPERWQGLRDNAAAHKLTASSAILSAYAETIARWSKRSAFCLVITVLNRPKYDPQVDQVVGDFTAVDLLEVNPTSRRLFAERAHAIQERLWQDLEHNAFTGMEVLREMSRRVSQRLIFPVVFTSMLGIGDREQRAPGGAFMTEAKMTYGISQTPQVWIDCQVSESSEGLLVNWDVRDGVFPDGVIDDAFSAFECLLNDLSQNANAFETASPLALPERVKNTREAANSTEGPLPRGCLQDGFFEMLKVNPEAPALVTGGRVVSYAELAAHVAAVRTAVIANGCRAGDIVAVSLPKGVWQIASVLAILSAGGIYLPIDVADPVVRRNGILEDAKARTCLTFGALVEQAHPDQVQVIDAHQLEPDFTASTENAQVPAANVAYIMYTSGTTGRPKGAIITHVAALNTVEDINRRFAVSSGDRVLGLAELNFDLSVFDIFGVLGAGGTLVLPDQDKKRDPSHWFELIEEFGVTLWNSVPAQMQMLLEFIDSAMPEARPQSKLRFVMLSGDWIPPNLPSAIRRQWPTVTTISLGGATEAAIWSIFHDVTFYPEGSAALPYGKPLTNQTFHVLNDVLAPCPDWTVGNLYIGGAGLALGYLNDEVRTARSFITHPESKERLYKTGDLGRARPDGVIDILGREDEQVKIRGHRIELGEVENAIQRHPGVSSAAAIVTGRNSLNYKIAAFAEARHLLSAEKAPQETTSIASACARAGDESTSSIDKNLVAQWIALANRAALHDMMRVFRKAGLFEDEAAEHTSEEIRSALEVHPKLHRLLDRWLEALSSEKMVQRVREAARFRLCSRPPTDDESAACWQELERAEQKLEYGPELLRYLKVSSEHLPELLRGAVDPLALLFPEGRTERAIAAYKDNLMSRCLNQVVKAAVIELAARHSSASRGPLRILEIGAGVGGATLDLVSALSDYAVEYCFTDISPFFLNEAKRRFVDYPWMTYGVFDINEPYWKQGMSATSWDIVICANSLHIARHAPTALAAFKELLHPGGALLVIETTGDIHALLTSMGFKEGLDDFTDSRSGTSQTFLERAQWRSLFQDARADLVCEYPHEADPLSHAGQTAFIVQFAKERATVTSSEIKRLIVEALPSHMVPAHIEILPKLPLTKNGKIDRSALKARMDQVEISSEPTGAAPADDLERRIAQLWAAAVGRKSIFRDEDFFSAGGDSLLIAQVVGRMRESLPEAKGFEWNTIMRDILEAPTVAAVAKKLRSASVVPSRQPEERPMGSLMTIKQGDRGWGRATVFFHTGNGNLAPYRHLFSSLTHSGDGGDTIAGMSIANIDEFLAIPPARLLEHLGAQYAKQIVQNDFKRLALVGYCSGGLIAVETARVLLEAGIELEPITIISGGPFRYHVEDELLMERAFGRLLGADIAAAGHIGDEVRLASAVEEVLKTQTDVIPRGALCGLNGSFVDVANCYRNLQRQSQGERLAALAATLSESKTEVSQYQADVFKILYKVFKHTFSGVAGYEATPFMGSVRLISPHDQGLHAIPGVRVSLESFWKEVTCGHLEVVRVDGNHMSCMQPPVVASIAKLLRDRDGAP